MFAYYLAVVFEIAEGFNEYFGFSSWWWSEASIHQPSSEYVVDDVSVSSIRKPLIFAIQYTIRRIKVSQNV